MPRQPGERFNCEGCGMSCIGALTKNGSVAPIELEPAEKGNVLLQRQKDGLIYAITLGIDSAGKVAEAGAELRLNHFAYCPDRNHFARRD